jgi:hypothetical protein
MRRLALGMLVASFLIGSVSAQVIGGFAGAAAGGASAGAAAAGASIGSTLTLPKQNDLTSSPYMVVVPPTPPLRSEEFPHAHIHDCDDLSRREGKC